MKRRKGKIVAGFAGVVVAVLIGVCWPQFVAWYDFLSLFKCTRRTTELATPATQPAREEKKEPQISQIAQIKTRKRIHQEGTKDTKRNPTNRFSCFALFVVV